LARAAAGLGAGRRWKIPVCRVIVASNRRDRVGGLAHTIHVAPDGTFDLGWRLLFIRLTECVCQIA